MSGRFLFVGTGAGGVTDSGGLEVVEGESFYALLCGCDHEALPECLESLLGVFAAVLGAE